jgi:hypothetical protein
MAGSELKLTVSRSLPRCFRYFFLRGNYWYCEIFLSEISLTGDNSFLDFNKILARVNTGIVTDYLFHSS